MLTAHMAAFANGTRTAARLRRAAPDDFTRSAGGWSRATSSRSRSPPAAASPTQVSIPLGTFEALPPRGESVTLFTHLVVRDDEWLLYGFSSARERAVFRRLLGATGVGSGACVRHAVAVQCRPAGARDSREGCRHAAVRPARRAARRRSSSYSTWPTSWTTFRTTALPARRHRRWCRSRGAGAGVAGRGPGGCGQGSAGSDG